MALCSKSILGFSVFPKVTEDPSLIQESGFEFSQRNTPSVLYKILQPVLHNVSAENTEGLTKKGHNFVIGLLQQSKKTGF